MSKKIRITIWNEYRHEREEAEIAANYPDGIHGLLKKILETEEDFEVRTATLDEPEHGLTQEVIDNTDVLMWWGHLHHKKVSDEVVERVRKAVYEGMGYIPMHSAHESKPFKAILGTEGRLQWGRNQKEIVWNMLPQHPIAAGVPMNFVLDCEELYGEPFSIPTPDDVIFQSWFEDGYIFRSGCCWYRGAGKIFYFQPGHEEALSYYNEHVQRVLKNAIRWVAPADFGFKVENRCIHALEKY